MKLIELINKIEVWDNWVKSYKYFVPKFIEEASTKVSWEDWDSEVFKEFFEKSNNQCVSSLQQGYFTKDEQNKIKNNWNELAPLLKILADNQTAPQWETYKEIKIFIRKFTTQNRKAATYRLIAGLQPNILCTIVNEDSLKKLFISINENIEEKLPKYQHNWFRDSHAINAFYKEHNPSQNYMDLISYPWQSFEYFKNPNSINDNSKIKDTSSIMKQYTDLLDHKKQIILQGPPGTGKTRLAKEIAKALTIDTEFKLTPEVIKNKIIVGNKIAKASGAKDYFTILEVGVDFVEIQSERSKPWRSSFNKIIERFNELNNGISPSNIGGTDPYDIAVANQLYETIKPSEISKEQSYKVIQFHPSYTYEDFVRGITVENNESGNIEYKTKNRVLAEYASKSLKNYNDFHKDKTTFSKEIILDEYFSLFIDKINEEIENSEGFYSLTKSVGIIDIDDDAFRYKSPAAGWNQRGDRMLFKDIKRAFLDGNLERQDLKKNENLSGLAKQHASYFVRVLNLFQQFLKDENLNFKNKEIEKAPIKNYVLIIDEINRANLSSVLGELIYALEYRGEEVESMYEIDGNRKIILPPNLLIIGTMNTADRSVGQIDYAIRRRFAFVDVLPKVLTNEELNKNRIEGSKEPKLEFAKDVFIETAKLFVDFEGDNLPTEDIILRPSEFLSDEFNPKDVWLGHSYFIHEKDKFTLKLKYEIKPILREYVTDGILKSSALAVIEDL